MKHKISKFFRRMFAAVMLGVATITMASCDLEELFVFGGVEINPEDIETFDGTKNAIFFALYNYLTHGQKITVRGHHYEVSS